MFPLTCRSGLEPEQPGDRNAKSSLVVIPVDPYRVHVYWRIESPEPRKDDPTAVARSRGGGSALRFHSIPRASTVPEQSGEFFEVPVDLNAPNWYVQLPKPSGKYLVELGTRAEDGRFTVLAQSGLVQAPPTSPSENEEEVLMLVMGDYLLPNPHPGGGEKRPASEPPAPPPATVSQTDISTGFDSVSPKAPHPPAPTASHPIFPGFGETAGPHLMEPDPGSAGEESKTALIVKRYPQERQEGLFRSGLSSVLVGVTTRPTPLPKPRQS